MGIECRLAGVNVGFRGVNHFGAFEHFPEDQQCEIDGNSDVSRDEFVALPRLEDVETVKNDDHDEERQSAIGHVWLEMRPEYQGISIHSLGPESLMELDVRDTNADPCEQIGNRGQVLEPLKYHY